VWPPPAGTVHLGQALRDAAHRSGGRDALVFPDTRVTYGELYERALRAAGSFLTLGLEPGDRVGLLMTNRPEFPELLIGAAIAGCVAVLINARYKARELQHVMADADLRCLITSYDREGEGYDFPALLREAYPRLTEQLPRLSRIFVLGEPEAHEFTSFAEFVERCDSGDAGAAEVGLTHRDVREPLVMLYTSGTTSAPKGCTLSHVNLVGKGIGFCELFEFGAHDRMWNPVPVFHVGFVMPLAGAIAAGGTVATLRWFEPLEAIRQLCTERITHAFPAFPPLWQGVADHPEFDATRLPDLRRGLLVGPPDLLRRLQRATPDCPFISCYGMTEGTSVFTAPRPSEPEAIRLGTEGRPLPGLELRIVDRDSGTALAPLEVGEIQIRGYSVVDGYHNAPEQTAEAFLAGGWFRTGDLGSVDSEGNLSFRGRTKDMLKVGGENVAALEVESYLTTHPEIVMAQVIGVPDARLAEVPAAFVELRPGAQLQPSDVVAFCRGRIATFKVPRYVTFVEEWPMSATKIQKGALSALPLGPRLM
jgi:acyl-CoA synthetase (AMP-forming)/AMP-acid ligase II